MDPLPMSLAAPFELRFLSDFLLPRSLGMVFCFPNMFVI